MRKFRTKSDTARLKSKKTRQRQKNKRQKFKNKGAKKQILKQKTTKRTSKWRLTILTFTPRSCVW